MLEEEDQAVAEEEADRLEVDGRSAHQLPCLVTVVEAEREPYQLRVDRLPDVHLHVQRLLARDQAAARERERAADTERDDQADQPGQLVQPLGVQGRNDAARQEDRAERSRLRGDRERDRDEQ